MAKATNNVKMYHQYPCPIDIWQRLITESADKSKRDKVAITPGKFLESILREKLNIKSN